MAKKETPIPADAIAQYEKVVAGCPEIQIKGAKARYTAMNGNMFSFLTEEGTLAVRLSKEEQHAFFDRHGERLVRQYGAVMRGYVDVPAEIFHNTRRARAIFRQSVAHAETLPAKPTTRKGNAKKKAKKKQVTRKKVARKSPARKATKKSTKKSDS